jgi:hypothetical protein
MAGKKRGTSIRSKTGGSTREKARASSDPRPTGQGRLDSEQGPEGYEAPEARLASEWSRRGALRLPERGEPQPRSEGFSSSSHD